ncbi:uncharacterized protein FIBRA_05291 [Fibroporia radiculosa]|uniref:3-ketodihydrosphingosine reductase TSC10 n=1 Tax=Fibroporia radiculosa TaxID=599839 RepID=J4H3F2_9APHY|nr:uncharacterized protein FIBRA_05291 [Fibroporia radiculosa]CCM03169.1 predicted protein [Fibroporia radiculosa]
MFISQLFKRKWDPRGRHCYITGGSSGLGLSLAILLTKKGADVSIVARNEQRLQKALEELEAVRQTPNQILKAYSYAVETEQGAAAALEAAAQAHGGKSPDVAFLCAGRSTPGFFVEQDEAFLRKGLDDTFWAQASSALVSTKRMVRRREKGKIVFVSSVLGYFSIAGYSAYSPGKFALRGLAEALQSELILYGIDVHICFPGTIYTPGYEEENRNKPKLTLKIEESDGGATPEVVAAGLLRGVQNGDFHITYDFIGNVFRASTAGSSPRNSTFLDMLYGVIGFIALPIWRHSVDSTVRKHRAEHQEYLAALGIDQPESAR